MSNERLAEVISMIPVREHKRIVACLLQLIAWMEEKQDLFTGEEKAMRLHRLIAEILDRMKVAEPPSMWEPFTELVEALMGLADAAPAAASPPELAELRTALDSLRTELRAEKEGRGNAEDEAKRLGTELGVALKELGTARNERDSVSRHADATESLRKQAEHEAAARARLLQEVRTELMEATKVADRFRLRAEAALLANTGLSDQVTKLERELADLRRKDSSHADETKAAVSAALAQMQAGLSSAMRLIGSAPATDLASLEAEIRRREDHLGRIMGALHHANVTADDLDHERSDARLRQNGAKVSSLEAECDRHQRHAAALQELHASHAATLQELKKLLVAHQRVARGLPPGLLGAALPPPPALPEAKAALPTDPRARLAALAKVHGTSEDVILLVTGFDLVAPGNMGIPRIVAALQTSELTNRYKPAGLLRDGLRFRPDKEDAVWQKLVAFSGTPTGGSMTFRRTADAMPWQREQLLSPQDVERFLTLIAKKANA